MKHKKPFQTDNKTNPFLDIATYMYGVVELDPTVQPQWKQ